MAPPSVEGSSCKDGECRNERFDSEFLLSSAAIEIRHCCMCCTKNWEPLTSYLVGFFDDMNACQGASSACGWLASGSGGAWGMRRWRRRSMSVEEKRQKPPLIWIICGRGMSRIGPAVVQTWVPKTQGRDQNWARLTTPDLGPPFHQTKAISRLQMVQFLRAPGLVPSKKFLHRRAGERLLFQMGSWKGRRGGLHGYAMCWDFLPCEPQSA